MKNRTCRACKYCGAHLDPEERRGYKEHVNNQKPEEDKEYDSNSNI